jgi:circadian clock protein KaiC
VPDVDSLALAKTPTGIEGLDEVTRGGFPSGRPTLIAGNAGCGKSLLAMSFLVNGATRYSEPGVFVSFEETSEDVITNVRSLGYDLQRLIDDDLLAIEHIVVDASQLYVAGEFDLEAMFIRIGSLVDKIGARRIVLDTVETLFLDFDNERVLRSELVRLFRWLKDRGLTAVITGERGGGAALTRRGIEEYVSDCVVVLDQCVDDGISTRSLRIAKYRGTDHGTNEYPFIIDRGGFVVLPITSLGLDHEVFDERISTGVPGLDQMIDGGGLFRGSSLLVSGSAGSGKTSLAASLLVAACTRGESAALFSFEESPDQLIRNMRSAGVDLAPHVDAGRLSILSVRPTFHGLETHLARIYRTIVDREPDVVAIDPMTSLLAAGSQRHARAVLLRLVDMLKSKGITAVFTSLGHGARAAEMTESEISSLMDTWISLRITEVSGERNRELYLLKSRGMGHSNQVREFVITRRGMKLTRPYVGTEGVVTGSARVVQELKERAESGLRAEQIARLRQQVIQRERILDAQIDRLRAEFEQERQVLMSDLALAEAREKSLEADREYVARRRTAATLDELEGADEQQ